MPISEAEIVELESFRKFAQELATGRPVLEGDSSLFADHFLLRFLRARQLDKVKAQEMLRSHFKWMEEWNPVVLMSKPFPELLQVKRFYPTGYHGVDKRGRPIYIEQLGKLDMARLLQNVTREQINENFIRESERQVRIRFPACCLARGEVVDRSLNIIDLEGLSFRLVTHSMAKKVVKEIMSISQDHYPEMCGNIVVINCPQIFSMAWGSLKSLLDENTIKKISIYDSAHSRDALLELVDEENLPKILGGRCQCNCEGGCLASNTGPWQRPDIVEHLNAEAENHWKALTPDGCRALQVCGGTEFADSSGGTPLAAASPGDVGDKDGSGYSASGDQPAVCTPKKSSEDGDPSPLASDGVSELGSLKSPSARENDAQRNLSQLFEEHKELERRHLQMLRDWVHEYHRLVGKIGRTTVERAQQYYDAHFVNTQIQQEQKECVDASTQLAGEMANLQEQSNRVEASFHAYLEDPSESGVSEEEWQQMIPDPPACPEDFRENGKLLRAWRMATVSDRLAAAKRRAVAFNSQVARVTDESTDATRRLEEEEAKHKYCTWNCSVRRAESFFERRREHEINVDKTVKELQDLEETIVESRSILALVIEQDNGVASAGSFARQSSVSRASSVDSFGTKKLTMGDMDMVDFYSCSESGGDDSDTNSVAG